MLFFKTGQHLQIHRKEIPDTEAAFILLNAINLYYFIKN